MRILILCVALMSAVGCVQQPITPPKTQLQVREFQTREYPAKDTKLVMKALINAFLDEGYLIKNADKDLGFISASKEADVQDGAEAFIARLFAGAAARFKKNSVIEASANVTEFGQDTRVRLIFQLKILDNFGSPLDAKQVEDEVFYQDFFSKVDKSLFIEKQRI